MTAEDQQAVPPGVDPTKPSVARIYDYFLEGRAWFEIDRVVGETIREKTPEANEVANSNRIFLRRAVRWLARQGITQFLDLGAGLPTQNNTHHVAQQVVPDAKVVYVDHDPMVAAHAEALLAGSEKADNVTFLTAEVRDPASILDAPQTRALIDFDRPVAVVMAAVVHFMAEDEDPYSLVGRYLEAAPSGSYLALSHFTDDDQREESIQAIKDSTKDAVDKVVFRTKADVKRFFEGLELMRPYDGAAPELVWSSAWGASDPSVADVGGSWLWSGVGRKP